jgi:hypothetical protein
MRAFGRVFPPQLHLRARVRRQRRGVHCRLARERRCLKIGWFEAAVSLPSISGALALYGSKTRSTVETLSSSGKALSLVGPCPVCGGNDRFSINIRKQVFNCRGALGGDVIALVQHLDACDFVTAIATLIGHGPRKQTAPAKPAASDDDEQRNLDLAEAIWHETSPLGPDAIAYFVKRRIDINQVPEQGGLRFHPRCRWPGKITKPCIIGRFTTAIGNETRGILRRPITGEKAIALGPMGGSVIRLWPNETVEQGRLVIGEGVETVLSAATRIWHRGKLLQPAWAVCVANNLKNFPILPGVKALTVLVDNDLPDQHDRRAGQDAAAKCAARWSAAGREVIRLTPKALGADFNDVVLRHGA